MQKISILAVRPSATITASEAGTTAVDVSDFQGLAKLSLNSSVVNAGTSAVKLQDSADGATGWADVPNAAFANVTTVAATGQQEIMLNADRLKRFVRIVNTLAGGANAQAYGVQLVGVKQSV